jgi:hypothetical protein
MRTDRALALLSRENPVDVEDLPAPDSAQVSVLKERILLEPRSRRRPRASRAKRISAASFAAVAVTAVAAIFLVGSPGGGRGVEDAAAAVRNAAAVTAESARRSGTVVVRITHEGELWAGETIRWYGHDLSLTSDSPDREGNVGSKTLVVDGIVYAIDPEDGAWVNLGGHENIDPESGTTPYEQLAAIREDVGGETLERITGGMTDLTTEELDDGSVVYSGSVAARLIARETGFKEGESIRVLPFGYVAHDEAENPEALLDAAVTVGPEGVVREIAVAWGTWIYRVAYSELGTTPAPKAPANARSLLRERGLD